MNDVERTTSSLNQNLPPLIADSREVLSRAKKLGDALASDEQIARYQGITRDAAEVASNAKVYLEGCPNHGAARQGRARHGRSPGHG